jgi:hypothetical protein
MWQMHALEKVHSRERGDFGDELPGQNFYRTWQAQGKPCIRGMRITVYDVLVLVECLFQTPQAFALIGDRLRVSLKDNLLRGGGTDGPGKLSQVGWAPGCPTRIADIVL